MKDAHSLIDRVAAVIKKNEGLRLYAYSDAKGTVAIGYGRNLHTRGINTEEAERLFARDLSDAVEDASKFVGLSFWASLDAPRQAVLVDMAYQLGGPSLNKFSRLRLAIRSGDWTAASAEILDSLYAKEQTPKRAMANADAMKNGEWPK